MVNNNLSEAQKCLNIKSVSLVSSVINCSEHCLNKNCSYQTVMGSVFEKFKNSKNEVTYYITFGLGLLPDGFNADKANRDDFVVQIEASYIIKYNINGVINKKALEEFGETNAPYHLWTYWREYIQSTLSRMSIQQMTLPMLLPGKIKLRKNK